MLTVDTTVFYSGLNKKITSRNEHNKHGAVKLTCLNMPIDAHILWHEIPTSKVGQTDLVFGL